MIMGRTPTKNQHLPTRMRARVRGSKTWYYYDAGGKPRREIPLGSDYVLAVRKWSDLHIASADAHRTTLGQLAERYAAEVIPTKAARTAQENQRQLKAIVDWFGDDAPLAEIKPMHVAQYLDAHRAHPIAANRAKALLSHAWNCARAWGYTDGTNPCIGVKGHREHRREVYIEDADYQAIIAHAAPVLRDTMRLMYLTGQRLGDVLKLRETDIRDGVLLIGQNKTGARLRIRIEGELAAVLTEIRDRKAAAKVYTTLLITGQGHRPLSRGWLSTKWAEARNAAGVAAELQLRDLRAKAGTDIHDTNDAQKLLGHKSRSTTEIYRRGRLSTAPTSELRNVPQKAKNAT